MNINTFSPNKYSFSIHEIPWSHTDVLHTLIHTLRFFQIHWLTEGFPTLRWGFLLLTSMNNTYHLTLWTLRDTYSSCHGTKCLKKVVDSRKTADLQPMSQNNLNVLSTLTAGKTYSPWYGTIWMFIALWQQERITAHVTEQSVCLCDSRRDLLLPVRTIWMSQKNMDVWNTVTTVQTVF